MAEPSSFTIKEINVSDAMTIELKGSDLPYGRPREQVAFETGGELHLGDEEGTWLPGRSTPIWHIMQFRRDPLVLKGAFRDKLFGTIGHANQMRDDLIRLGIRANLVEISWESDSYVGLMKKPKLSVEGPADIAYELTFLISTGPATQSVEGESTAAPPISLADYAAEMSAMAAAEQAAALSIAITSAVRQTLVDGWAGVDACAGEMQSAAQSLETQPGGRSSTAMAAARRVDATAQAVQNAVQALQAALQAISADDAVASQNVDDRLAWYALAMAGLTSCQTLMDEARTVRVAARAKILTGTKLYSVQAGDTLESIAQAQLGSRARAGELGLAPDALAPGLMIRIPAA